MFRLTASHSYDEYPGEGNAELARKFYTDLAEVLKKHNIKGEIVRINPYSPQHQYSVATVEAPEVGLKVTVRY